ncbi:MAG: hypothetical protein R3C03_03610 [Pirellulaceae bacterium]
MDAAAMNEVDLLMQNAILRDQLEPYMDESMLVIDLDKLPTEHENEYLTSLLAWERAPVLPICDWFEPRMVLPPHHELDDEALHQSLHQVIGRLYEKNIILEMTDHLSDRQLYCLISRDILTAHEKRVNLQDSYLRWQCLDPIADEESWLRYYASSEDRQQWSEETLLRLPPRESLPFPRSLPNHA